MLENQGTTQMTAVPPAGFPLSTSADQPPVPYDALNIAYQVSPKELDTIGQQVVEDFQADVDSRTDYDKRRANWRKLFSGFRPPKDYPWVNCSNTHIHFLAFACLQFQARAVEALIGGRDIATCFSKDGQRKDAATRSSEYLNYQLRYEMEEWEDDMDKLLMALPLDGFVAKKTYYDPFLRRPCSRFLDVDELVISYKCRTLDDPMTRKTHILWMHINDIKKRQRSGIFRTPAGLEILSQREADTTSMPETVQVNQAIDGVSEPDPEHTNRRRLLEQHVYLDLNYDPKTRRLNLSDGILRPYVVTVDPESRKVLRISCRQYWDQDYKEYKIFESFTGYTFIPNPSSVYGFGFGQLLDHLNETADTILNQLIDAGHLSNIVGGLIAGQSGMKKGDITIEMGKFVSVNLLSTDDIRKAIYQWDFKEPSQVLFALLGILREYAKETTTTSEWMGGALPPSDTAATTMLAVIEQGLKVFSGIQKRCHRSLRKELKKIFILDGQYLDEQVYYAVQDSTSQEIRTLVSGRADFASNIEVIPNSDPNISSRAEKLIRANEVLVEVKTNPLLAQNPESLYYATRSKLEALETKDIDLILGPKPGPPPPPPDLPPEQENALFLQDRSTPVLPTQNQVDHLQHHIGFQESTWAGELKAHGKKLLEAHIAEHKSALYLQEEEIRKSMATQVGGNGGGVAAPSPTNFSVANQPLG